jgi:hypothetical protein
MISAIRRAGPAVLVVDAGEGGFEQPRIGVFQRELSCPMVLVR